MFVVSRLDAVRHVVSKGSQASGGLSTSLVSPAGLCSRASREVRFPPHPRGASKLVVFVSRFLFSVVLSWGALPVPFQFIKRSGFNSLVLSSLGVCRRTVVVCGQILERGTFLASEFFKKTKLFIYLFLYVFAAVPFPVCYDQRPAA